MEGMNTPLTRRSLLKGVGVTMALPLLESTSPAQDGQKSTQANKNTNAPTRMAVLYMANGVNQLEWAPKGIGAEFELSSTLSPLRDLKSDILVMQQLCNKASEVGDGHYVKIAPFLTGTPVTKTTGSDLRVGGISMDQLVAQRVGNFTPIPSLELSVEPVTTGVDTNVGFTRLYGSHISWSSPTTPVTREISPQQAFDRLFRRGSSASTTNPNDKSVLDAILADARRLEGQISKADRLKMTEYLDAVRSVEKRIAFDALRRKSEAMDDPQMRGQIEKLGTRIQSYYAIPEGQRGIDHTEQVRLMLDIMVIAFWSDSTRVATFLFANEVSGKNFSFLPGVNGGHHEISHHENNAEKLAQYQKISQWHMAQYAYMLGQLKNIKEGEGNLLDNSMILMGSGIKDGNSHSPWNLPLVLGGKGGGAIATGRHLVYEKNTPLCNLYRSMMKGMGVTVDKFGDSTGELTGIGDKTYTGLPA
jgi:hypothetical protein